MGLSTGVSRLLLLATLAIVSFQGCDGQGFAAMSIDFGSKFLKIGLVKPGVPMEIVLNKESRRKTPNLLMMSTGERAFGDPAVALNARYPQSMYSNLNDLVAKSIDHPIVQQFQKDYPHIKMVAHENRSTIAFPVGDEVYSVEMMIAMILSNARAVTETFAEQTVKDVVISVPAFFNQAERKAIVNAAKIAKLNLLQLINDGTAAGLNYGVFRRKEVTDKPQRLMIYDMGASKTTATLLEYKLVKEKYGKEPHLIVLGVGYDRTLGGEVMTLRLRELLIEKFRANYKTEKDITTNLKALAKMYKEAERVKQVLSANVDHFAQIESVHEDKDMRVKVTREELNGLIADLEPRMGKPVRDALDMAGLTMDMVDQIVLMGAGTRVPKVQEVLQAEIGGKELGRFLNTDEAIAMGALYQAAHLSKGFKVKPFDVDELQIYPIQVSFLSKQKEEITEKVTEKQVQKTIFGYKASYPTGRKVMSFTSYTDDFTFDLAYGDLSHFSEGQRKLLGSVSISQVTVTGLKQALEEKFNKEENEFKGVKAAFTMDGSGIVRLEGAEALIERKPKGVVESLTNTISGFFSSDGKKDEGEPTEEKTDENMDEGESVEKGETEEKSDEGESVEKEEKEEKKSEKKTTEDKKEEGDKKTDEKKKDNETKTAAKNETEVPAIVKVKLTLQQKHRDAEPVGTEERKNAIKVLEKFDKEERLRVERQVAENELESYAFEASLLAEDEEFMKYSTEEEREKLVKETTRVRAWLEDDTDHSTPTVEFTGNLRNIKDIVTPVKKRIDEDRTRPAALEELEKYVDQSKSIIELTRKNETAETTAAMKEELETFQGKLDKVSTWLAEKKEEQSKLALTVNAVLTTEEIKTKTGALRRAFTTYFTKVTKLADDILKQKKKEERAAEKKRKEAEKAEKKGESVGEGEGAEKKADGEKPSLDDVPKSEPVKETDEKKSKGGESTEKAEDEKKTEL